MIVRPRLLLASDDRELQARLSAAMAGAADLLSISPAAANLLQALVDARPALLVVDLDDKTSLQILIGLVRRADPMLQAVAIGDARNAGAVLAAVRAGAADFLDRNEPGEVLRAQILRHVGAGAGADSPRPAVGGFELTISAQPGSGESLFALNLAVMRARAGGDMLLIDCILPTAEAGAALDIRTPYTVQDAIKDVGRLDRTLATSALARHDETGLMVLPLATAAAPDVDAVSPESLTALVAAMRPLFRNTLMAAGGVRSPGALRTLMQAAARTWFVCPQKFTAVVDGRQLIERIDPGPDALARTTLVVDEHQSAISLTDEQMRVTLGLPAAVRLPPARVELLNSLNTGRPLVLEHPRGAYALALSRLEAAGGATQPATVVSLDPTRLINEAFTQVRARIAAVGGR